jgi:hypothetical protein
VQEICAVPKCYFKALTKSKKTSVRDLRSSGVLRSVEWYSAVHNFWSVKQLVELVDGSSGSGKMARGVCSFAWNFSVTKSTILMKAQKRTKPNITLPLHQ